jgi:PTH1 family peptidyl-tRNA hydrolase
MKYIIGLGNPGSKYAQTRHNVGFWVVDALSQKLQISMQEKSKLNAEIGRGSVNGEQFTLIKPLSFMNLSGQPVRAVIDFFQDITIAGKDRKLEELYVVFDDLDVEVGTSKVQFGKGPHGHNGLNSIYEHLGTQQFWHVRLGVDGRQGARSIPPDRYVLQQFAQSEKEIVDAMVEEAVARLV